MIKNNQEQLTGIFKQNEGPEISRLDISPTAVSLSLNVPNHLRWFEGHFPEQKVLPGVVQIDWAGKLAKALFADLGPFRQLGNIKFKTMVLPDTDMELEMSFDAVKGNVKFHYFNQTETFSMGSFKFSGS